MYCDNVATALTSSVSAIIFLQILCNIIVNAHLKNGHLIQKTVKKMDPNYTQCAKVCGPHNRACKYGCARLRVSQFLAHAVVTRLVDTGSISPTFFARVFCTNVFLLVMFWLRLRHSNKQCAQKTLVKLTYGMTLLKEVFQKY